MAARKLLSFRHLLPRAVLAAGLLVVLVIGMDSSGFALIQPAIALHHPQTPTRTPLSSPTPSPTPFPPPPLVYLLAHGNPNLSEIALTFDDGPAPDTQVILTILRRHHVRATFFMLGIWVQYFPDLARAVVANGHAIGDHTWNHPNLTRLSASQVIQQITNTRNIIQQVTGVVTTLVRPPYGAYTHQLLNTIFSLKCSTVLWNSDPRDWSRPGANSIINYVLNNAQNGSIILLHDGGGDRSQTIAALPTIIEQLQARGFTFVTIPQMMLHLPPTSAIQIP
jgi:peptidoglycan/xylan/chitin deacetylase (PgdA/CDA1 family)